MFVPITHAINHAPMTYDQSAGIALQRLQNPCGNLAANTWVFLALHTLLLLVFYHHRLHDFETHCNSRPMSQPP